MKKKKLNKKNRYVAYYQVGNVTLKATIKHYSVRDALDMMNRAVADGNGALVMTKWREDFE